jgi:nitrous oxide reductase accessory protein NosL
MPKPKALTVAERHSQIIALLAERGSTSIEELGRVLRVSKMTVHRDLDALAAEKRLRKVHGGAALIDEADNETQCYFCHGEILPHSRTKVTIYLHDGTYRQACCPHCGLLALSNLGASAASALVTDFLHGRVVNAQIATYVVGADLDICCAPTTLAFHVRADADRFQRGFGGQVLSLNKAIDRLQAEMSLTSSRPTNLRAPLSKLIL